jgi:pyrroline-5-carboxylate reductase
LFHDIDGARAQTFARDFDGEAMASGLALTENADIVLLAVKPAQVVPVLKQVAPALREDKLLVSIAAGVSISTLTQHTGKRIPVTRVMPNTVCLVGKGATAVAFDNLVSEQDRDLILRLFAAVGMARAVAEDYMDAVTAVSGSGPAYLFLVAEAMTDAAVEIGLSRELARDLVNQTLMGASYMLQDSGEHPALLRERVTSPGGTTIAGLRALEEGGLRSAVFNAIDQACRRSKLLGQ